MLTTEPRWTFASKKPLTQWYGNVQLLDHHVVGQWFCLARESGELKWQHRIFRANAICEVDSGVIVASEVRSDGPWTDQFGCYGISLDDGRLLWTSHGSGVWGWFQRVLDFVPGYTNEFRDSPHHVKDGRIFCHSGRVLDVYTGKTLERTAPDSVSSCERAETLAQSLYGTSVSREQKKVSIGNGILLFHPAAEEGRTRADWEIIAENESGEQVWRLPIKETKRHIDGDFYSYRLAMPYLYLVVSDERRYRPHPTKPYYVQPNPTLWHLMAVSVRNGNVVQDISLGTEVLEECRIEDVDDRGLLTSSSSRELLYFERIG